MIVIWLSASLAHAGCDVATLQSSVEKAENTFVQMDEDGFAKAVVLTRNTLDCLTEPLTPVSAAGFHRVNALEAFLRGDHAKTIVHFQAVRGSQPGYELPDEIAPEGHPLRVDFDKSSQFSDAGRFPLDPPETGWLLIDGSRATEAPGGRPFIFQWVQGAGQIGKSGWVDVGAALPSYPVKVEAPPPVVEEPKKGGGKALTWVGLTTTAVGAGLYGVAFVTRGQYDDAVQAGDEARIRSSHTTTNVLAGSGVALLGGGATLTLIGVF
ncbi:MAG: hypothetical protein H6735_18385 [Alphaproteobacteria bacterium]|nr:hypothetical protein [Alphaproteobacteria bacterium]